MLEEEMSLALNGFSAPSYSHFHYPASTPKIQHPFPSGG